MAAERFADVEVGVGATDPPLRLIGIVQPAPADRALDAAKPNHCSPQSHAMRWSPGRSSQDGRC